MSGRERLARHKSAVLLFCEQVCSSLHYLLAKKAAQPVRMNPSSFPRHDLRAITLSLSLKLPVRLQIC